MDALPSGANGNAYVRRSYPTNVLQAMSLEFGIREPQCTQPYDSVFNIARLVIGDDNDFVIIALNDALPQTYDYRSFTSIPGETLWTVRCSPTCPPNGWLYAGLNSLAPLGNRWSHLRIDVAIDTMTVNVTSGDVTSGIQVEPVQLPGQPPQGHRVSVYLGLIGKGPLNACEAIYDNVRFTLKD
jgi:hypothetical protein